MPDKVRNIFPPLTQCRKPDRHDIEAVEQILAKQPLADLLPQVAIGGSNDTNIGTYRPASADGRVLTLLQNTKQSGLRLQRHVTYLVQEECRPRPVQIAQRFAAQRR